ncbi:MAG TPA: glycosyltransferase [Nitrospiria bacterium]|nr:glycosyltransferase [Nitrospiria bacterium]
MSPKVSVVLPVYNGERYVADAVRSVQGQTWRDFELLVIDDGSTDRTAEIVMSLTDSRIRVVRRPHEGLIAALNAGLAMAAGDYIARQDADDQSLPRRFERQIALLDARPELCLVGAHCDVVDEQGRLVKTEEPPDDHDQLVGLLERLNCFSHGSVMFRRAVALQAGGYRPFMRHVEDYDLWLRMSERWRLAVVPEVLYRWRAHGGNVTARYCLEQERQACVARLCARRRRSGREERGEELRARYLLGWGRLDPRPWSNCLWRAAERRLPDGRSFVAPGLLVGALLLNPSNRAALSSLMRVVLPRRWWVRLRARWGDGRSFTRYGEREGRDARS